MDSIAKSAIAHYQFEAIHAVYHGNGGTGRIINVLCLVLKRHLDLPILYLSSQIIENKAGYYRLLRAVTSDGAWQEWIEFYLKAIELTARQSIRTIERIKARLEETIELVRTHEPRAMNGEQRLDICISLRRSVC